MHAPPSPPKLTLDELSRPVLPAPNALKSPAPVLVVECWCGMVKRMASERRQTEREKVIGASSGVGSCLSNGWRAE